KDGDVVPIAEAALDDEARPLRARLRVADDGGRLRAPEELRRREHRRLVLLHRVDERLALEHAIQAELQATRAIRRPVHLRPVVEGRAADAVSGPAIAADARGLAPGVARSAIFELERRAGRSARPLLQIEAAVRRRDEI